MNNYCIKIIESKERGVLYRLEFSYYSVKEKQYKVLDSASCWLSNDMANYLISLGTIKVFDNRKEVK